MKIQDATTAFIAATKNELFGQRVNVYSVSRQLAAQAMGMRFGFLSDDDQVRFSESGSYDGIFLDSVLVGWLCSVDDETVMDAIMNPIRNKTLAVAWAEENKVSVGSKRFQELVAFYIVAVTSVLASEFEVKTNAEQQASHSGSESGND